jgi:Flp pilus assembly pilin Flp
MIEYGLITALVAFVSFILLGGNVTNIFTNVTIKLKI